MSALAARNRRTAILTIAGVGFVHAVALGVVILLMSAGRSGAEREVPQRPALRPGGALASVSPVPVLSAEGLQADRLEGQWTAHHKDTPAPWRIDAQGRITWR